MEALITAMSTALGDVATQCLGILTSVVPLVLPVIGGLILVKFGIRAFKSLVGR